jgi:phospholipid/cholesterol/gamma-HCH transport system substrate-binding protein
MPRTRSLAWAELKIGVVSIVAVIIAILVIFELTGEGGFFWQRYSIKTVFADVAGLKEGAPVRLAGMDVGSVKKVTLTGDQVEVVMEISRDHQSRVTTTSIATLGSTSLLGEAAVDLTSSSSGTPIPEWGYVRSGRTRGSIGDVATQAGTAIEDTTALINDLRSGKGTMGRLLTDEQLYNELTALMISVQGVTDGISKGHGTLGRLINDPAAAKSLEASLDNLQAVTARIRNGEGSLGKLLNDDTMHRTLTSTTSNLDSITGRISRGEGTAGKLISDAELYNRLNSLSDRIDKVMAGLQQGDGTAGQLLRDRQLYENMNGTMAELKSLVSDIRKDPKKYLNVKVSLF